MNEVVRFKMDSESYLVSDDNGKYVEYDDYANLEAEAQALRGEVSRLRLQIGIAADIASDPDYEPTVGDSEYDCALHDAIRALRARVVVPGNLLERCREILEWQKTGILKGDALRSYCQSKIWGRDPSALRMGEGETAQEAYSFIDELARLNGKAVREELLRSSREAIAEYADGIRSLVRRVPGTDQRLAELDQYIADLSELLGEGKES